eukprot:scaffold463553_cov45-Prasinocladus_malaysianus.AAC.3
MDDKGLAAIFVFGLPGFLQGSHAVCCVTAALNIFSHAIKGSGIDFTAGITTGSCFCGLIGDLQTRSEYAVMGGEFLNTRCVCHKDHLNAFSLLWQLNFEVSSSHPYPCIERTVSAAPDVVNTAARLAVHAAKTGQKIMCSSEVSEAVNGQPCGISSQLCMKEAGTVKLKGREGLSPVFIPETKETIGLPAAMESKEKLVGRERHLQRLRLAISRGKTEEHRVSCVAVSGDAGMGKTFLVEKAVAWLQECSTLSKLPQDVGRLEVLWLHGG